MVFFVVFFYHNMAIKNKVRSVEHLKNVDKRKTKQMQNYVNLRALHDEDIKSGNMTKTELAMEAGFTHTTASKNNLENTNLYAELSSEMINKTGIILHTLIDSVSRDMEECKHELMSLDDKIKIMKAIASVYKGLMPTFKQKKTFKDENGNIEIVWKQLG